MTIKTGVRESSVDFPELVVQKIYTPRIQWEKKIPHLKEKLSPFPGCHVYLSSSMTGPTPPALIGGWRT